MTTRKQAAAQARREAKKAKVWIAVISELDEHTGEPTFGYCPVNAVNILYRVTHAAGLSSTVEVIDPAGHSHPGDPPVTVRPKTIDPAEVLTKAWGFDWQ